MKNKKLKIATSIISLAILITPISTLTNNSNIANAETNIQNKNIKANNTFTTTIDLSNINIENELLKAQQLLEEKKITQEEYKLIESILKPETLKPETNNIRNQTNFRAAPLAYGAYYPARKVAYINNWGVREIYYNALPKSKGISATISFITGKLVGGPYGWGLAALGIIQAFGGPSAFERAIQQAYWQGKGIDVYYHISKSIMSLNYVSYVVI